MRKLPSEFVVAVPSCFPNKQSREKVNKTKQLKLQNKDSIKSHILLKKKHFRPLAVATVLTVVAAAVALLVVEVRVVAVEIKRTNTLSVYEFF